MYVMLTVHCIHHIELFLYETMSSCKLQFDLPKYFKLFPPQIYYPATYPD